VFYPEYCQVRLAIDFLSLISETIGLFPGSASGDQMKFNLETAISIQFAVTKY
jgi:hypothetical protein